MVPFSLLLAIILAFGLGLPTQARPLTGPEVTRRLLATGGVIFAVALAAASIGLLIVLWNRKHGRRTPAMRECFIWGSRLVGLAQLAVFGWILIRVDWPRVVGWGFGLRRLPLIDEALILLPFLLLQIAGWSGLYPAERVFLPASATRGLADHLIRKGRQSLGMVLPLALLYALGRDAIRWYRPDVVNEPGVQFLCLGVLGAIVLSFSPLLVRFAWPTRPLPAGPLRDRLLRLARRCNFRCTEILVWDTGGTMLNAGVTGAWPIFRYVLLTDSLIERLEPAEVEAVFGHEIGHIAHRHLAYFGLFFLGSMGVMSLLGEATDSLLPLIPGWQAWLGEVGVELVRGLALLGVLGLYILVVFGFLSRRFERQADVFGCRAVSCGQQHCPPHTDPNALTEASAETRATRVCPTGVRIFASALAEVAASNGMSLSARSWRHGSIRRRIAFLKRLPGRPDIERRFETRLGYLQAALALALVSASTMAWAVLYGPWRGLLN